jgi:hypothetical protein
LEVEQRPYDGDEDGAILEYNSWSAAGVMDNIDGKEPPPENSPIKGVYSLPTPHQSDAYRKQRRRNYNNPHGKTVVDFGQNSVGWLHG